MTIKRWVDAHLLRAVFAVSALLSVVCSHPGGAYAVTHDVDFDKGGRITHRAAEIAAMAPTDRIRIRGRCDSACTLFLGHPGVCVYRRARLGFHGSHDGKKRVEHAVLYDQQMALYYPPRLRERFMSEWRHLGPGELFVLTGSELIEMGVPDCAEID